MAPFNKNFMPKFYQIFEDLYKDIREGHYQEGDRIPSESELIQKYQVSRGTIREALKMLLHQGFIIREKGKGTFVTYKKIEQDAMRLMGFTELMSMHNKKASARILEIKTKKASKRIRKLMGLSETDLITKIQRLRFGNDEPLIIERSYFVYELFKIFLKFDLEKESIYSLMYRETNLRLGSAQQSFEAVLAGPEESKLLNIQPGSPLLLMKRLIFTNEGKPFQYSEDMYRSDKLKFTVKTLMYDETHSRFDTSIGLVINDLKTNVPTT